MRYKEAVMKRILLEGIMNLGDLVASTAAVSYLRRQYPQWEIYYLIRPGFEDLLAQVPGVAGIITYTYKSGGGIGGIWRLAKKIKTYHFDLFLTFDPRKRTSIAVRLAGIPIRIDSDSVFGWHDRTYFFNRHIPLDGFDLNHHQTYEAFIEVVRRLKYVLEGMALSKEDDNQIFSYTDYLPRIELSKTLIEQVNNRQLDSIVDKNYVVLTPSRRGNRKVWPIANWIPLIDYFTVKGYYVVLVGSKEEALVIGQALVPALKKALDREQYGRVINVSGWTSLMELLVILAKSQLVMNIDNGIGHVAGALGCRVITLFDDYSGSVIIHKPAGERVNVITDVSDNLASIQRVIARVIKEIDR